jgi:glycolate oxidase FAD binding subunit
VKELSAHLAEHGQYLPFDPLLAEAGATLGGTVAAGTSGPGRYRYGGVRDFILGIAFVDGEGRLIRSGGAVVKNAAGFDMPKLMVGSLGRLGVLAELTFKVFPEAEAYATLEVSCDSAAEALAVLYRLTGAPLDLAALDVAAGAADTKLWARLAGVAEALPERVRRLQERVGGQGLSEEADRALWREAREIAWAPADWSLAKVPLTPARIPALDAELSQMGARRRYSAGGQVAWVAWQGGRDPLEGALLKHGLAGLLLRGDTTGGVRMGKRTGEGLARRVKEALDAGGRFGEAA